MSVLTPRAIEAWLARFAQASPERILLRGHRALASDGTLITEEQCWTAAALWQAITQRRDDFVALGIQHLGLGGDNSPDWLITQLAAWQAGIVVTPLPTFFSAQQTAHVLEVTRLDAMIFPGSTDADSTTPDDEITAILASLPGESVRPLTAQSESVDDRGEREYLEQRGSAKERLTQEHLSQEHLLQEPREHERADDGHSESEPLADKFQAHWLAPLIADHPREVLWLRQGVPASVPPGTNLITFTSGTTGSPKGVCLSLEHLGRVLQGLDARLDGIATARHGVMLPLAVLLENLAGALFVMWRGGEVVIDAPSRLGMQGSGGLSPARLAEWLLVRRPTSLILVPGLLQALVGLCDAMPTLADSLRSTLTLVAVGGGRIATSQLVRATELGLPIAQGYGMSEMGSVVCLGRPDAPQSGSVGEPLPGLELRIDHRGQILINGPRMCGYLGMPGSYSAPCCTAISDSSGVPDGTEAVELAWASGDLGRVDTTGQLWLEGRARDVLITAHGRNISPEWLESELEALPGVQRALVCGEGLLQPIALMSLMPGNSGERLAQDMAVLNARLPDYAQLAAWQVLSPHDAFSQSRGELTANGRLRRAVIHARHARRLAALSAQVFQF